MNNGPSKDLKNDMSERLRKSRESWNELRAETQAKARRAARITNNYAHDHPWRMVITGAALALAAGLLIRSGGPRRPRRIVMKQQKPVVKIKAPKPEKKHSTLEAAHAIIALVMFGLKAFAASRPHNKIVPPHDSAETSTAGAATGISSP